MIWLDFIKRCWPILAGFALLIGIIWWHKSKLDEAWHIGYRTAMQEVAKERDTERALNEHKREVAERDYQTKVSELETRVDRLLARHEPAIRMCAGSIEVRIPEAASVADDSGDRGSTEEAGRDLRPQLVSYGKGCEGIREKLTELQGWIDGLR